MKREEFFQRPKASISESDPENKKGLNFLTYEKYTNEELLQPLRDFFQKHKRSPTIREVNELSKQNLSPSADTYQARWTSLNDALRAAGLPVEHRNFRELEIGDVRQWMKAYVINFQQLKPDEFPTLGEIERDSALGLCPPIAVIRKHYGSMKRCYQVLFGGKLRGE